MWVDIISRRHNRVWCINPFLVFPFSFGYFVLPSSYLLSVSSRSTTQWNTLKDTFSVFNHTWRFLLSRSHIFNQCHSPRNSIALLQYLTKDGGFMLPLSFFFLVLCVPNVASFASSKILLSIAPKSLLSHLFITKFPQLDKTTLHIHLRCKKDAQIWHLAMHTWIHYASMGTRGIETHMWHV